MYQLPHGFGRQSKRLVASYVADWVFIMFVLLLEISEEEPKLILSSAIGLVTYGLSKVDPVYHPFSLVDLSISYPYKDELISTTSLALAAIVGPAIIIFLVSILLVPRPYVSKRASMGMLVRRKLWEWHTGWLGGALSVILALLITTGVKNIFGKPRPNALARCQPDTSLQAIQQHAVGTYAADYSPYWVLVDVGICTQTDRSALNDGFRSFPSGHSSTSWAGLLYLSLYLCSKFAVVFPYLPGETPRQLVKRPQSPTMRYSEAPSREQSMDTKHPILSVMDEDKTPFNGRRNEAAAPPLYLLIMLILPLGVAFFICATRFYDYRHHGFDIISGSLIGIFTSWFSFRWYHMPIARGSGWSWGPRSPRRAFAVGVGSSGYVEPHDPSPRQEQYDLEMGVPGSRAQRLHDSSDNNTLGTPHNRPDAPSSGALNMSTNSLPPVETR